MVPVIKKRCVFHPLLNSTFSLIDMLPGQTGVVVDIDNVHGLAKKLCVMGIIPGKKITKISQILAGGPIVIRMDSHDLALGRGVARRIKVRVDR